MALKPQQLPGHLSSGLRPVYLIAGAEPLLVQECRDQVIQTAQAAGFTERTVHEVAPKFNWDSLNQQSASLSLFSSQKILDVRLPTGKPGREGAATLTELAESSDPDVLLLVSCNQWDASSRKSKWAAKLAAAGVLVEIWPVKPHELPSWIRQRMQQVGLNPQPEAVNLLTELVEGNLLAAQQEITKLRMVGDSAEVTVEDVSRAVADSSRFDAFRLVECALAGELQESLRVATGLKRTDVAIQAVSGALYREISTADLYSRAVRSGENDTSAFRKLRVWQQRQGPMKLASRRLSTKSFERVYQALSLIDRQSKGRAPGDPWHTLDRMLCYMCDPNGTITPS